MTEEILFQNAAGELDDLQSQREEKQMRARAILGDGAGNLIGPSGNPWVLARLGGDVNQLVQAYNGAQVVAVEGMSVLLLVKYKQGRVDHYEVERLSNDVAYVGYAPGGSGGVVAHHISHEYGRGDGTGGWDAVNVYERMITALRVNAQVTPNLTVQVAAGYYSIDGLMYYYAGGNSGAFTPPGAGSEYHVLTLDKTGTLNIEVNGLTSPPVAFALTADRIPLAAVYLIVGQTSIADDDVLDLRPFLSIVNTTASAHNLLSTTHPDTLAGSVATGDIVYGNATPKWARMAIGSELQVLNVRAGVPSWSNVDMLDDALVDEDGNVVTDESFNIVFAY